MNATDIMKQQFLEIVNNQIRDNDPEETAQTLERLKRVEGYKDADARLLIAQCVSVEIFEVLKHNKPFDQARYVANLNRLPESPFEEEDE
jgi:hypothetical protein